MGQRFKVDLDHLDDVTTRMRGFAEFVEENLDELERRIADLHLTWSGPASARHAEAHREWDAGARDVREGFSAMEAAAKKAHESYSDAVSTNLRMLGR